LLARRRLRGRRELPLDALDAVEVVLDAQAVLLADLRLQRLELRAGEVQDAPPLEPQPLQRPGIDVAAEDIVEQLRGIITHRRRVVGRAVEALARIRERLAAVTHVP